MQFHVHGFVYITIHISMDTYKYVGGCKFIFHSYTYILFTLICQYVEIIKIFVLIMPLRSREIGKP